MQIQKFIIITSLLLASSSLLANTVTTQCPEDRGQNTVIFNDQTVQSGQPLHLVATNQLRLKDFTYPMTAWASQYTTQCLDGACTEDPHGPAYPVLPSGLQISVDFNLSFPALSQGIHHVAFEVYVPGFDCRARAFATITAV